MRKVRIFLMAIVTATALSGCASLDNDLPSTNEGMHSGRTGGGSGGGSCH